MRSIERGDEALTSERLSVMNVEFLFSLDDLAEVTERALVRRAAYRRARFRNMIGTGLLSGIAAFFMVPAGSLLRLGVAILTFVCAALAEYAIGILRRRSRLRDALREQTHGDGPFRCAVTIEPSGLAVQQFDATTHRPWSAVRSIEACDIGVEIVTRDEGATIVRDRAFQSPDARAAFIGLAREYLENAR